MCALCFYIYSPLSSSIPNHLVCSRLHYLNSTLCFLEVRFSSLCLSVHLFFFLYFTCASSPFAFCLTLSLFLFPTIFDTRGVETTAKQKMKMKQVFILPTAILKMFRDFSASPCPEQKKKIRRLWPSALLYLIRLCVSASVVGPR